MASSPWAANSRPLTVTGGDLSGTIFAGYADSITVGGSSSDGALLDVNRDAGTITINGVVNGHIALGSVGTLKITGALDINTDLVESLGETGRVEILRDAGTITLGGGTMEGSSLIVKQSITQGLSVGGLHSGLISTRRNVGTVTFSKLYLGLVAFGGDVKSLTVTGTTLDSVISAGTWVGADGLYNTPTT